MWICKDYQQDDWAAWWLIAKIKYNNIANSFTKKYLFYLAYDQYDWLPNKIILSQDINIFLPKTCYIKLINLRSPLEKILSESHKYKIRYNDDSYLSSSWWVERQVWFSIWNIWTTKLSKKLDHKYHSSVIIITFTKNQAYRLKLPPAI